MSSLINRVTSFEAKGGKMFCVYLRGPNLPNPVFFSNTVRRKNNGRTKKQPRTRQNQHLGWILSELEVPLWASPSGHLSGHPNAFQVQVAHMPHVLHDIP